MKTVNSCCLLRAVVTAVVVATVVVRMTAGAGGPETATLRDGMPNVCKTVNQSMASLRRPCMRIIQQMVRVWKKACGDRQQPATADWCVGLEPRPRVKRFYKQERVPITTTSFGCCSGWTQRAGQLGCLQPAGGDGSSPSNEVSRLVGQSTSNCRPDVTGRCQCLDGFFGDNCEFDIDECARNRGGCEQICCNTWGSFTCGCQAGYRISSDDPSRCDDVDECAFGNAGCSQFCQNVRGSFRCSCGAGYSLMTDGRTCRADGHSQISTRSLDPCDQRNGNCQHVCNWDGFAASARCSCHAGFALDVDLRSCSDIDECSTRQAHCQQHCLNTHGSFVCSCNDGFRLADDRRSCIQCPSGTFGPNCLYNCSMCRNGARCSSYYSSCECPAGYVGLLCNETCPFGTNGPNCKYLCRCADQSLCDHVTGVCKCKASAIGTCEELCPPGYWGEYCELNCLEPCPQNENRCGRTTGRCQQSRCPDFTTGPDCRPCPQWMFGVRCQMPCQCNYLQADRCDPVTGRCFCSSGFTGSRCQEKCRPGLWGPNCARLCQDQCGQFGCDPINGSCICPAGRYGQGCLPCPNGFYGHNCQQQCRCVNGALCNPTDGTCECLAGFRGRFCEQTCPAGFYGINCAERCACKNGASCDSSIGRCICPAGFTGEFCERQLAPPADEGDPGCPSNYYGRNCDERCECHNDASCDPVSGACRCRPGYVGTLCEKQCQPGWYGRDCLERCECGRDGRCSHETGACERCERGWRGTLCNEPCPPLNFGLDCAQRCNCPDDRSTGCSPVDGTCWCKAGYEGTDCSRPCRSGTWGVGCIQRCQCANNAGCSPVNGRCQCPDGWTGNRCDERCVSGRFGRNCSLSCADCATGGRTYQCPRSDGTPGCECESGWTGQLCDRLCDAGTWGVQCLKSCPSNCPTSCNRQTGGCDCPPGYQGADCSQRCPAGKYGRNCALTCNCQLADICNAETGECSCAPDNTEARCARKCPPNQWGPFCSSSCECFNNASCNEEGKCRCAAGFVGSTCAHRCPTGWFGVNCTSRCHCPYGVACRDDGSCICPKA